MNNKSITIIILYNYQLLHYHISYIFIITKIITIKIDYKKVHIYKIYIDKYINYIIIELCIYINFI